MKLQKWNTKGLAMLSLMTVFLVINSAIVLSQNDMNMGGKELNRDVWSIQASSVAQDLELKNKSGLKLVEEYLIFREDIAVQSKEKLHDLEGEARENESDKIIQSCLDGFSGKLSDFLTPEQASQAFFVLGSLNKRWDQYLTLISGFGLEDEGLNQTSKAVYEYISVYIQERKKASDANTRFSGSIATALKEELDGKIVLVLDDDQYAAWSEATAFKRKS